ncbi:DUF1641 domain-containing protein [Acidicapsa acidisoli]|uniref:DUF1641 domain-containing protein n=1 Tax=Acidicapsa acidisoli TaxID=1615681 RepID=UPI0021DF9733|nr:hypothetical protein [Acidicapsa acidisoli]
MATAVDFRNFTPVDARVDLIKKLEGAPAEHAEAVLAAYELLRQLHEKGILELLTGLLTAGEAVVNHAVGIISSPQAVTATRLGLMMVNMLGSIDADKISTALAAGSKEPPSLLSMGKQVTSKEARSAMAVGLGLLTAFGEALEKSKPRKLE